MVKVRKDWVLFFGVTPMLLNALFYSVGSKPVVLIALATSLIYAGIFNIKQSMVIKWVLSVSTLLLIAMVGYIYSAVLVNSYSAYRTIIYAQAYYIFPIAMITFAHVFDFRRVHIFFLVFISSTVLQHVIFGFQGRYISHHMSEGVSNFPGITGHYHNSYIASFALILSAELMKFVSAKVSIKNIFLIMLTIILLAMPVFGASRGAILTNLVAISVFALVKLRRTRIQTVIQIVFVIFFSASVYFFVGDRLNNLIAEQNTYGYSNIADVVSISEYSSEENYTGRVEWWQETLAHTLSTSPLFGSIFENLDDGSMQIGHFNGSFMHSYFMGTLQDGGILLFLLIAYLLMYPIVILFKSGMLQENITKVVWLIAIIGALATNTWMYDMKTGPIYSYLYAYTAISILRASERQSSKSK